ncbi:MAG: alcohol dehydrogenase [Hyphomicrobiales bacterium]|nr:alcohol dehydrogenase [Hyphomicrobiales bacterium]
MPSAITVDQADARRLVLREVNPAPAKPGEVTIRVTAISLNRGEVKRALTVTPTGTCPGWDFAGVVEDDHGVMGAPAVGARVVGMLPIGAWAQQVSAPIVSIAVIPDKVTDAQAASLPVAGLTALHVLRKGGLLLGKKVLVDGASGGVGQFAIQLAAAAGVEVYSHIRQPRQQALDSAASTGAVIVGDTLAAAVPFGPFDLVVDGVGGSALSAALTMLRRNGVCVTYGATGGEDVRFDNTAFFNVAESLRPGRRYCGDRARG